MPRKLPPSDQTSPVVVAGIGGSGTRLIAQILQKLGFYIGSDLNSQLDNLWFTLLFKTEDLPSISNVAFSIRLDIFLRAMTCDSQFNALELELIEKLTQHDRPQHPALWLQYRSKSLLDRKSHPHNNGLWGWKEPNSHIVLDRLHKKIPGMKYIHVMRNGLDLAFSQNQNQLSLWGKHFIGGDLQQSPYYSLKYWCMVHQRIRQLGAKMGPRFLLLNYDNFCSSPEKSLKALIQFLGMEIEGALFDDLLSIIKTPDSIGRYQQHPIDCFDSMDIEFVRSLGFKV